MHLAKLMTVLSVCILLGGSPLSFFSGSTNAIAQPPNTKEADRPTQRWLPLPQGDGADLSEQAQLLQKIRDLISSESLNGASDKPLPKLTEEQLREMEKALESMRDLIGDDKLPNLESIPKEWIDQALSDPILRKQAQQLLEQYARDRKLPQSSDRTPRNSQGVPFPRRPSDKSGDKSNDKSGQNPKSNTKPPQNSRSNTAPQPPATNSQNPRELFPPVEDPFSNSSDSNATESPDASRTNQLPSGREPSGTELSGKKNKSTRGNETNLRGPEQQGQPEGSRGSASDAGKAQPSGTPSSERPLPTRPDAERIEALQELFKKLKTIEGQKSAAPNVPNRSPGSNNQSNPAMPPRTRSNQPSQNSNQFAPPNSPDLSKDASGTDPFDTDPSNLNKPNTPDSSSGKSAQSRFSEIEKQLAEQRKEAAKRLQDSALRGSNSPSSNSLGSNSLGSNNQNFEPNGNRANSTERSRNGLPGKPGDMNSPNGSGYVMQDAELRTQLERQGLGRALQSIVEKTMKEQGESNPTEIPPTSKSSSSQSKSKDGLANNQSQSTTSPPPTPSTTASRPTPKIPDATKRNNGLAAPSVPPSNQNANSPSMMSGWRDTAAQFWGAIRSTPGESSSGSSASTPSISGGLGDYGFVWNGRAWLVLGLVLVLCAMLLLLARKRIVLASAAKEAEAELAKEILTEGIRTRADVVRAFHRFVLRRAQPVADWWNHRYVAAKLSDASPQLRSVISDLASVYEHARYLPPEAKLSSEEIDRVQAALKQCAASGA